MKKETVKVANVHTNHRQRLLAQINKVGFENLNDIQALEFILTYIIPRKDTNPIAHNLLKKFGSIANIIDADEKDIMSVYGMGERSAKLLTLLPKIFFKYSEDKVKNTKFLSTNQDLANYCHKLLSSKPQEEFFIICLNKQNKVLSTKFLGRGTDYSVGIDKKKVLETAISTKDIYSIVLTHNHPNGSCKPSTVDVKTTDEITNILKSIGVRLYDHCVVGIDGCYSINKCQEFMPDET